MTGISCSLTVDHKSTILINKRKKKPTKKEKAVAYLARKYPKEKTEAQPR
jgi:hypothetical protein